MNCIEERLDYLKNRIQDERFLKGKGLSNEVNINFFCYKPKEEMIIRHYLNQITNEKLNCHIIHYDLYEVFLNLCEDKRILNRISLMEERKGKEFLGQQLIKSCDAKAIANQMQYPNHQVGDVIFVSGVGKVFPFVRVHNLLEAMQPLFNDVPIVVFYPGTFDGYYVKMFNKLKGKEYYRAVNII